MTISRQLKTAALYDNRGQPGGTSYGYDDIGRLTSITASGKAQTFVYDTCTYGKGRVCTVTDPAGTFGYTYTKEGLVASQQITYAPVHGGYTSWDYTYDAMGRPLTMTDNGGVQQQLFTYTSGQLSAVKVKIGAAAVNVATGTKPINQAGLGTDDIHAIKKGLNAQPKDWVGIRPDGHVWINEGGEAADQGPHEIFLP